MQQGIRKRRFIWFCSSFRIVMVREGLWRNGQRVWLRIRRFQVRLLAASRFYAANSWSAAVQTPMHLNPFSLAAHCPRFSHGSIVVSIPRCGRGDPGSNPGRGRVTSSSLWHAVYVLPTDRWNWRNAVKNIGHWEDRTHDLRVISTTL